MIRFLFTVFILVCSTAVYAQTLEDELGMSAEKIDPNVIAGRYYDDCMKIHAAQKPDVAETLCACTASGVAEAFDDPQYLRYYGTDTKEGRQIASLIHNEIYMRCTEYAVRQITYDDCMAHEEMAKNPKRLKICNCIGDAMAAYTQKKAREFIGDKRSNYIDGQLDKNAPDPLAALMTLRGFSEKDRLMSKLCIQKHMLWLENQ